MGKVGPAITDKEFQNKAVGEVFLKIKQEKRR